MSYDYAGDVNANAAPSLFYCNVSDNPGCLPTIPLPANAVREEAQWNFAVTGLGAPDDEGDSLLLSVQVGDPDGATVESLQATVVLPAFGIRVSNLIVGNIEQKAFEVSVDYLNDQNMNADLALSYCNITNDPACTSMASLGSLTRGTNSFYLAVGSADLAVTDSAGDTLQIQVTTTDVDGVLGSPQNYTFTLATTSLTHIYRSVGPGMVSALQTGSGNAMTISGTVATFDSDINDNIGVGDGIQFDSTGEGAIDEIVFIKSRLSSKVYVVRDKDGLNPTEVSADEDWSVFRAHTSLGNAENGIENVGIDSNVRDFHAWSFSNDIVALNQIWHIALYADAPETQPAALNQWTTSEQNYLRVFSPSSQFEVGQSQKHEGVWDESKSLINVTNDRGLYVQINHVIIEGLQIKGTINDNLSNRSFLQFFGQGHIARNNLIRGDFTGSGTGLNGIGAFNPTAGTSSSFYNNIIFGFNKPTSFGMFVNSKNVYAYNNTIYNCTNGMQLGSGTVAINNIVQNTTNGFPGTANAASDSNLSDHMDAPGANSTGNATLSFANPAGGDFRLVPGDADAIGTGQNLTNDAFRPFSSDVIGGERSSPWDLGAFKY